MRSLRPSLRLALAVALAAPGAAAAQDPLGAIVAEGLRNNLGLATHRLADRQGELEVRRARGQFLPVAAVDARWSDVSGAIDLGKLVNPAYAGLNELLGEARYPTDIQATLPFRQDMRLRVTQPLFNGALIANLSLQRALRDVQRGRLGASARELAAGIQAGWLRHAAAARAVAIYEAALAVLDESVRFNRRLVDAGQATPEVLSRARADRAEAAQRLADAVRLRDAAARSFNQLMARPLTAPVEEVPDTALRFPLVLSLEEALASGLARREELAEADGGMRAARAQRQLAGASFLPSVALALDYGFQGNQFRFTGENDFTIASVVVQWNLFNGGQDATRRQQAALEVERTATRRAEAAALVELDVRQAYEAVVVARDAIATASERLAAARRTFELVRRRYEEGLAPHLEFSQAQLDDTNAALNEVVTRLTYATRMVELERAAALRPIEP